MTADAKTLQQVLIAEARDLKKAEGLLNQAWLLTHGWNSQPSLQILDCCFEARNRRKGLVKRAWRLRNQ